MAKQLGNYLVVKLKALARDLAVSLVGPYPYRHGKVEASHWADHRQ